MKISSRVSSILVALLLQQCRVAPVDAFTPQRRQQQQPQSRPGQTSTVRHHTRKIHLGRRTAISPLFAEWKDDSQDNNKWKSADDVYDDQEDWESVMSRKKDGSFWTSFEPGDEDQGEINEKNEDSSSGAEEVDESEAWLDTLASLQAEEVEFNLKEAERADKARQMQEWGFDASTIQSTLEIAVDTSLEDDELEGMQSYREESYIEEEDLTAVESHVKVPKDVDTGDPIRSQMVYVDEHTCIGTYCKPSAIDFLRNWRLALVDRHISQRRLTLFFSYIFDV